jgi:hypothetical protein
VRNYTSFVKKEGEPHRRDKDRESPKPPRLDTLIQSASVLLILQENGDLAEVRRRLSPLSLTQFEAVVTELERRTGGAIDKTLTRQHTRTLPNDAPDLAPNNSRILLDTILRKTIGAAITAANATGGHGAPIYVNEVATILGYNDPTNFVATATRLGWDCSSGLMKETTAGKK